MAYLDQVSYGGTLYDVNDTKGRAMIAPKEESSTASAAHAAGTYFTYNDLLYRATADIAAGGTITPNTNCVAVTVGAETSELKSAIGAITGNETVDFSDPALKQYIPTNGAEGSAVQWETPSVAQSTQIKWAVVECAPGDVFTINGKGGNTDRLFTFLTSAKTIIGNPRADSGATAENLVITAPANAAYLVINDESDKLSYKGVLLIDVVNGLAEGFDNYLEMPHYADVAHVDTPNKIYNTADLTVRTLSGFSYTIVPVTEGEIYNVTGAYSGTNYNPVFASESAAIMEVPIGQDVTVPAGATRLIVNGRPAMDVQIAIKKLTSNAGSMAFFEEYDQVKSAAQSGVPVGVSLDASGNCRVFQRKYDATHDLETLIMPKSGNNLPDIYGFYATENLGDAVLVSTNANKSTITQGTTDFISPHVVYAVNNMNGDFPDMSSAKLTGGWHRYNNSTSTGTATARNISYKVFCDGKQLNAGESQRGHVVRVEIVNRLQASNTEKEDGTGREVVEQKIVLTFDAEFGCRVYSEITALEDVKYERLYGISTYYTDTADVFFVGCRAKRGGQSVSGVNRCGDLYCTEAMQIGATDIYRIGFDPTFDLGGQYANHWGNSFTMAATKSYAVLIYANGDENNMLAISVGGKAYFKGYYACGRK